MKNTILPSFVIISLALPLRADFSIPWFTIGGGGGTSSGGGFSISGVAGQDDAGEMVGDPFSLASGFWSRLTIQSIAAALQLTITLSSNGSVIIEWPATSTGYVLQQNSNLGTDDWEPVPQTPAADGTTARVIVDASASARFYRLKK